MVQSKQKTFLDPACLAATAEGAELVLPMPAPARPQRSGSRSSRLRHRFQRRLEVWRSANKMVALFNGLDRGTVEQQTTGSLRNTRDGQVTAAWQSIHSMVLSESAKLERVRRGSDLTGVQAVGRLTKVDAEEICQKKIRSVSPQVSLIASIG